MRRETVLFALFLVAAGGLLKLGPDVHTEGHSIATVRVHRLSIRPAGAQKGGGLDFGVDNEVDGAAIRIGKDGTDEHLGLAVRKECEALEHGNLDLSISLCDDAVALDVAQDTGSSLGIHLSASLMVGIGQADRRVIRWMDGGH